MREENTDSIFRQAVFSCGRLFFSTYAFELAAVKLAVHDTSSIRISLVPNLIDRILELRPFSDGSISVPVACGWVSSHFFFTSFPNGIFV